MGKMSLKKSERPKKCQEITMCSKSVKMGIK